MRNKNIISKWTKLNIIDQYQSSPNIVCSYRLELNMVITTLW